MLLARGAHPDDVSKAKARAAQPVGPPVVLLPGQSAGKKDPSGDFPIADEPASSSSGPVVSSSPSPHLPRKSKSKDIEKLKMYLDHFRRIQIVDRTWNFSHSTITAALQQLARVTRKCLVSFCQTKIPKPCTLNSKKRQNP